ncbi:hypothetical protein RB623_07925 [Mesorhizobium sp. LHD-90]|uniref:hypothetical protein n=1 Tax=Mesorhizobium sp. LHD-90 TaxID=3071414 RepID=UPI0027E130FE|nr:hypothetical protein [Mesorhizobium sp. LHD-90]MDQ6433972.1 hypothetical protein [Mesorhizobium sp. LHD-90]
MRSNLSSLLGRRASTANGRLAAISAVEEAYRSLPRKKHRREDEGTDWQKVADRVERLRAERPADHISSLLSELRQLEIGRSNRSRFYETHPDVGALRRRVLGRLAADPNRHFYFPNVVGGRYAPGNIGAIRYLLKCVRDDTSDIVELGSGWSSNLFQLYVGLGRTRSETIHYHGAEFTKSGRSAALALAAHDAHIRYGAYHFDYRKPDLSFLPEGKGHVLVFTRHSVEQVDLISDELYSQLAARRRPITLVHIEPVAWQSDPKLLRKRLKDDAWFFGWVKFRMARGFLTGRNQLHNAAWWSWRLGYNVNLLAIIDRFREKKLVELVAAFPDFDAQANIVNPSSLYHIQFLNDETAG